MRHDCEPWVSQFGTCPFTFLDEEEEEEEEQQDEKAQELQDADEFNTESTDRFPWELLLPFLSDAGRHGGRVDLEHYRFEDDRRRFTEPRTYPRELPLPDVEWERVAAILTGILAGTAIFLQRKHPMGQIAARLAANSAVPYVLAQRIPPEDFRQEVLKRKKYPWAYRARSLPFDDPDVRGGPEGPIIEETKDFGVWYYQSYTQEQDLGWSIRVTRGPRWIDPTDPQWTTRWSTFWNWSEDPHGLGGARPPFRPGEVAPGDWAEDTTVFETGPTTTTNAPIDESLLDDSMI